MRIRTRRVAGLALAFVLGACATQAGAPYPSDAPEIRSSATPRAVNLSDDVIYVRLAASGETPGQLVAYDARTSAKLRSIPGGSVSRNAEHVISTELVEGGGRTAVRIVDLATGTETRRFTIDGAFVPVWSSADLEGQSADGKHIALMSTPYRGVSDWRMSFAVVDLAAGTSTGRLDLTSQLLYSFVALSPDGRWLYLNEFPDKMSCGPGGCYAGGEPVPLVPRVYDVSAKRLLPRETVGREWDGLMHGFRTERVSADGRWMYAVWAIDTSAPVVTALDLAGRRVTQLRLPEQQRAGFEQHTLWSVLLSRDVRTLYAVNAALGIVNEIDPVQLTLQRTSKLGSRVDHGGVLAAIGRAIFPIAEAKRGLVTGAVLSPDGRTIYAASEYGITVIDTSTLQPRAVWDKRHQFSSLAMSPDGERLYAIADAGDAILIRHASDGADLGKISVRYAQEIVRIDPAR